MTIIDASVYVATVSVTDAHHARSFAWFQQALSNNEALSAPSILLSEVSGALSRNLNNRVLAHQAIQQLVSAGVVQLVPVTHALAERAAEIAADHRIRGCDAVYVALAEHLDEELVTLDNEQLQRGAAVVTTRQP